MYTYYRGYIYFINERHLYWKPIKQQNFKKKKKGEKWESKNILTSKTVHRFYINKIRGKENFSEIKKRENNKKPLSEFRSRIIKTECKE